MSLRDIQMICMVKKSKRQYRSVVKNLAQWSFFYDQTGSVVRNRSIAAMVCSKRSRIAPMFLLVVRGKMVILKRK